MTVPFGVLNLNKPPGVTSRQAVNSVQRLVRPAKAGHAGTLDPLATGVLVVCVGPATRLISFAQKARKVYRAVFRFGVSSETDDLEGTLVEHPDAPRLTAADISAVLPEFVGTLQQVPPAFSAVHVEGQRAYDLSRQGKTVDLSPRPVDVHRFELLSFDDNRQELTAEIECGGGTYIRSLGRDVAKRLGTTAVMTALERTAVGPFRIDSAVTPDEVTAERVNKLLRPAAELVRQERQVTCNAAEVTALRCGRAIPKPGNERFGPDESVAVFCPMGDFVGIAQFNATDATLKPRIMMPG